MDKTKRGKTQKEKDLLSPNNLLRAIAKRHLQKKMGRITENKRGRCQYWVLGGKLLKHHVFTDSASKTFIATLSESIVKSAQDDNATFVGIHYYGGLGNIFTVYFFKPEIIVKHYIDAEIEHKKRIDAEIEHKNGIEWHVTIRDDNENLLFTRTGDDDVTIPVDSANYFLHFKMDDEEYRQLLEILPEKKKSSAHISKTLKVKVRGKQGEAVFSITSAVVIAILSVLTKVQKPLTIEEMDEGLIDYGVLTRAKQDNSSVRNVISKIIDTGGITSIKVKGQPRSYILNKGIKVNVKL